MSLFMELLKLLHDMAKEFKTNKDSLNDQENEFLNFAANAVNRTLSYLKDNGNKDATIEKELSDLWSKVAIAAKPFNPDLARRCYEKGNYWADPSRWSNEDVRNAGIEIKHIQQEIGSYFDSKAGEQGAKPIHEENMPSSHPVISSKKPWYKNATTMIITSIIVLAALTTLILNLDKIFKKEINKSVSPLRKTQQTKNDSELGNVEFSPITLKGFFDQIKDDSFTDLQKDQFLKQHLGRKVEWRGYITRVDKGTNASGFEHLIFIVPNLNTNSISNMTGCWFSKKYRDDLLLLKKRQEIVVSGVLDKYDSLGARLVRCELKRVVPVIKQIEPPTPADNLVDVNGVVFDTQPKAYEILAEIKKLPAFEQRAAGENYIGRTFKWSLRFDSLVPEKDGMVYVLCKTFGGEVSFYINADAKENLKIKKIMKGKFLDVSGEVLSIALGTKEPRVRLKDVRLEFFD